MTKFLKRKLPNKSVKKGNNKNHDTTKSFNVISALLERPQEKKKTRIKKNLNVQNLSMLIRISAFCGL